MTKIDYLPALTDSYDPLLPQQLQVLREQVVLEGGNSATIQSKFNYAWALIKSNDINDQRLGVKLLTDIYKESQFRRRECLYYMTIGYYKLNDFTMAKRYIDRLYEVEPNNRQVIALKQMIEDKIQRETMKGVAIGVGIIAGIATAIGFIQRRRK